MLTSERVNTETVTIQDLLDKLELKGETVVIHNGEVKLEGQV